MSVRKAVSEIATERTATYETVNPRKLQDPVPVMNIGRKAVQGYAVVRKTVPLCLALNNHIIQIIRITADNEITAYNSSQTGRNAGHITYGYGVGV